MSWRKEHKAHKEGGLAFTSVGVNAMTNKQEVHSVHVHTYTHFLTPGDGGRRGSKARGVRRHLPLVVQTMESWDAAARPELLYLV